LHHLLESIKSSEEHNCQYEKILNKYNQIKGNHRFKKIIDFRNKLAAHNSAEKKVTGFSLNMLTQILEGLLKDSIAFLTQKRQSIKIFLVKLRDFLKRISRVQE
tara:strand:- start:1522 stop:1833 length:312 start_codon:yes stop_codon:yes gene_type:complete